MRYLIGSRNILIDGKSGSLFGQLRQKLQMDSSIAGFYDSRYGTFAGEINTDTANTKACATTTPATNFYPDNRATGLHAERYFTKRILRIIYRIGSLQNTDAAIAKQMRYLIVGGNVFIYGQSIS